jgi:hypothetical protein
MRFDYDYLNKLVLQVDPNTPVASNEGNLARAQIGFSIAIVATKSTGGLQQVFLESPGVVNKDVSITTPPGMQSTPTASGSRTNRVATLQRDIDGDNIADQYTLTINGFSRVDTRLVLQDQLLRTNVATVTGTPIGIGGFLQSTDNATVQLNTHPQPAPPLGSASIPNNGLPASNSSEPNLIGAVMPGTEALFSLVTDV